MARSFDSGVLQRSMGSAIASSTLKPNIDVTDGVIKVK